MNRLELEISLDRPPCPDCGTGNIRPIEIHGGRFLLFNCPCCQWRGEAELPQIRKTIIYLDTSIASNMAKALRAGDTQSPWWRVYDTLRQAAADEMLCCTGSSILQSEAELSQYRAEIINISKKFGDPKLRHELEVREAQLFRALDRFLSGTAPIREIPPREDAFERHSCQWLSLFRVGLVEEPYSDKRAKPIRISKVSIHRDMQRVYSEYTEDGYDFADISQAEARGYGQGIIADGLRMIQRRLAYFSGNTDPATAADLLPTTFDSITYEIKRRFKLENLEEAFQESTEFLRSEHVCMTPFADLSAQLYAAFAITNRGPMPRLPSPSDACDIGHIATFMPYVDVFIADRFTSTLCNCPHMWLGETYETKIRSLGINEIDEFIRDIDQLRANAPHIKLVQRIKQAIGEGGYIQEQTAVLQQWLRSRGVDPDAPKSGANFKD